MPKYVQKNLIESLALVFGLNFLATYFSWYRLIWWFDMPMHFLGGVFVSWLVLYIIYKFSKKTVLNNLDTYKKIFLLTLIVGLGWEWFEWATDIFTGANDMHLLDSYSDLFFDMAGSLVVIFILNNKKQDNLIEKPLENAKINSNE